MIATYSVSRNTSEKTLGHVLEALNKLEHISVTSENEGLFKTKLHIVCEKDLDPTSLIALGALIGSIEASQYF